MSTKPWSCNEAAFRPSTFPQIGQTAKRPLSASAHVYQIGLDQVDDPVIWEHARTNGFVIVTKDADFTDLSVLRGFPPKVLWLKLGNCTTQEVEDALRRNTSAIADFATDPINGLLEIRR